METPLLMMAVIVATGLVLVVIPVAHDTYQRFRHRKLIICPENKGRASVRLKAWRTGFINALGRKPVLQVKWCSRWPERKGCDEKCVKENWPV